MPAYIILDTEIADEEAYSTYRTTVPAVVRQNGGRYLVREGDGETLEGEWPARQLVVVEFDDRAAAKSFYESREYRQLIGFRQRAGNSRAVLVDGYVAPKWQPPL